MSEKKLRVGIFGGSFSPPHLGHLGAARAFLSETALDALIVIPAGIPPHKTLKGDASPEQRVEMCRLTFGELSNTEVSELEIRRSGKSYTALTLEELSDPKKELYLLVGTDMFLTLDEWYAPEVIFKLSTIVLMRREGDAALTEEILSKQALYSERYGARIRRLSAPFFEISSDAIRNKRKAGEKISAYVVPKVEEYIDQWQLYKG